MSDAPQEPPAEFRFSIRRLLLLIVLVSIVLAGSRVLPPAWLVWLATGAFYLAIVLLFTRRGNEAGANDVQVTDG